MFSRPLYNSKLTSRAREMRQKGTLSEVLLWNQLKQKKLRGLQFYRQFPIGHYIVDFYCKELKLAIEIDGGIHRARRRTDTFRQGELEALGVSVLRFQAKEVEKTMDAVLARIKKKTSSVSLRETPPSRED